MAQVGYYCAGIMTFHNVVQVAETIVLRRAKRSKILLSGTTKPDNADVPE